MYYEEVISEFTETFPGVQPPIRIAIRNPNARSEETWNDADLPCGGRPRQLRSEEGL